jgi:hypothetical protein
MKKSIYTLIIIGLLSCDISKTDRTKVNTKVQIQEQDTDSFIFKVKPDTILKMNDYGCIYITEDTSFENYDRLIPKSIDNYKDFYSEWYDEMMKKLNPKLNTKPLNSFPLKWSSLYVYQNKYFVYSPIDWLSNSSYYFTDSILYRINSDGDLEFIIDYLRISKNIYEFKLLDYFGSTSFLKIYFIDRPKGIAIWENLDNNRNVLDRKLMVNSNSVKFFPMIVSDSGDRKAMGFKPDFDTINYNKLIKNVR